MTAKIITFPVPAHAEPSPRFAGGIILHVCAKRPDVIPVRDGERCRWCGEIVTQFNHRPPPKGGPGNAA